MCPTHANELPTRILIADDDPIVSRLLKNTLTARGYEIMVTEDAILTWQAIQRGWPDLVILDIKMPGGSGLAVLRRLKNNLRTHGLPVIVITAADEPSVLQQALALHPEALFRKPLRPDELETEIMKLIGKRAPAPDQAPGEHVPH